VGWAARVGGEILKESGEGFTEESWPTMHDALVALMFMAVVMFPCFISVGRIE
jgi:hypothetical protein